MKIITCSVVVKEVSSSTLEREEKMSVGREDVSGRGDVVRDVVT